MAGDPNETTLGCGPRACISRSSATARFASGKARARGDRRVARDRVGREPARLHRVEQAPHELGRARARLDRGRVRDHVGPRPARPRAPGAQLVEQLERGGVGAACAHAVCAELYEITSGLTPSARIVRGSASAVLSLPAPRALAAMTALYETTSGRVASGAAAGAAARSPRRALVVGVGVDVGRAAVVVVAAVGRRRRRRRASCAAARARPPIARLLARGERGVARDGVGHAPRASMLTSSSSASRQSPRGRRPPPPLAPPPLAPPPLAGATHAPRGSPTCTRSRRAARRRSPSRRAARARARAARPSRTRRSRRCT